MTDHRAVPQVRPFVDDFRYIGTRRVWSRASRCYGRAARGLFIAQMADGDLSRHYDTTMTSSSLVELLEANAVELRRVSRLIIRYDTARADLVEWTNDRCRNTWCQYRANSSSPPGRSIIDSIWIRRHYHWLSSSHYSHSILSEIVDALRSRTILLIFESIQYRKVMNIWQVDIIRVRSW